MLVALANPMPTLVLEFGPKMGNEIGLCRKLSYDKNVLATKFDDSFVVIR